MFKIALRGLTATSLVAITASGVLADAKTRVVPANQDNQATTIQLAQHGTQAPSQPSGGTSQGGMGQGGMGGSGSTGGGMGMGGMGMGRGGMMGMDDKGMGGMGQGGTGQGGMGMGRGGMMGMDEMGMGSMGMAPGTGTRMAMPSALPGFPGASHLYHVGSTGFFLDYADKLGLSVEQKSALNAIKQRAVSAQSTAQRKVAEAEEALWTLTAAEQPDAAAIESKVREIEKLKSDQRLTFIRAVGDAGKLLTADQQRMVRGLMPMPPDAPMSTRPMK
jgi:Spy/CpxP family protein refolding chaperone